MQKARITGKILFSLGMAAFFTAASQGTAWATPSYGCKAIAAETAILSSSDASTSYRTGSFFFNAGERVYLHLDNGADSTARSSVRVMSGANAAKPIFSGSAPHTVSFAIPADGLYSFEILAESAAAVSFAASCDAQYALPSNASPEAFTGRRTSRIYSQDTGQASLRRRDSKAQSIDQAVKNNTVLDSNGAPAQVSVSTSVRDLAAAEGQTFANNKLDIWAEGRVSQFEQKLQNDNLRYSAKGNFSTLYLGSDYLISPKIMVGGLVQLDQFAEYYGELDAAMRGKGVMFGPYASIRLAPDLVFDARAAWGNSDNSANLPQGTSLTFETNRKLFRGQLSGNRNLYGFQLSPTMALSVVEEAIVDVEDLPDGAVDDGSSLIGRLAVGSSVSYRVPLEDGAYLQPRAALTTDWGVESIQLDDFSNFYNNSGARAEAGFALGTANGVNLEASGALEGIGDENYSAWSGRVRLTAPLN